MSSTALRQASPGLKIARDLAAIASGYVISGPDPSFTLISEEENRPHGVWCLQLSAIFATSPLYPELLVQAKATEQATRYKLPELVGGSSHSFILNLPEGVEKIELLPGLPVGAEFNLALIRSQSGDSLEERIFEQDVSAQWTGDELALDLVPVNHLRTEAPGVFISTDLDPQFQIAGLPDTRVQGWTVIRLAITTEQPVRPILYVWSGNDISEIALPILHGKIDRRVLVRLPDRVDALRFDPADRAGVVVSELGLWVQSFAQSPPAAFTPVDTDLRRMQYKAWAALYDQISADDDAQIRREISVMPDKPLISVLMPVYNPDPRYLRKAIESVRAQIYEHWELCIADDASPKPEIRKVLEEYQAEDHRIKVVFRPENGHISAASNSALELVSSEFVALMDHDDELPQHALYMVALEILSYPDVNIIYTDEDKIDGNGRRHDPYFKSSWSLDLFYSQNFVAHLGVYRASLVRAIGGFRVGYEGSQDYDLVLRLLPLTRPEQIRHIPHVLYHWRIYEGVSTFSTDNPGRSLDSARRAMVDHFELAGASVQVVEIPDFPSWWRIVRPAPTDAPLVTIIIPTRDRVELLKNCINSIKKRTEYSNYEIIIVDNDSIEPSTLAYFSTLKEGNEAKILRVDEPFNYSRLNNLAAAEAKGEFLLLLNNDIVVINPEWLGELVAQVSRTGVGAVGAKLRYGNDSLQHAGVTLGLNGVAGHGHRHFGHDSIGYFGWPQLQRDVSAVTGAALIVRKDLFYEIGGLDEQNLVVSYNDVDLCLRIRERGYQVLYDPFAELHHLESVSRGADVTRAQKELQRVEREFMKHRWGAALERDPFYSPNLSLDTEDFQLAFPPRSEKPWRHTRSSVDGVAFEQRRRFDASQGASPYAVRTVVRDTAVIIANQNPYSTLTAFAALLEGETLLPAQVVVVDSDAVADQHVGRAVLEAWRARLPTVPVDVIPHRGANIEIGEQVRLGLRGARPFTHVVVIAEECHFFAPHSFDYLVKSYVGLGCKKAVCGIAVDPDNRVEVLTDPADLQAKFGEAVDLFTVYENLPGRAYATIGELLEAPPLASSAILNSGVFMGQLEWFHPREEGSAIFYKTTQGMVVDISRQLARGGHRIASATTCIFALQRCRPRDLAVAWKHYYDFVWLNRSSHGAIRHEGIEFVCPFHRGDVLIGLQVAHALVREGKSVRFHVASDLLTWAADFAPDFVIRGLDIQIPPAERTSLELWRGIIQVIARPDSSPSIILSHPERGLDILHKNLVGSMLEGAGLRSHDKLRPLSPIPTPEQLSSGRERLKVFGGGGDVVLLHTSGGWALKTIPEDLVSQIVGLAHDEGYKVVQIGGPADAPIEECDGHILAGLNPGEWSVLFRAAKGLIGVDSWSAHLAAILDTPQLTVYGSTQPEHVSSRGYLPSSKAHLIFPPRVDCSPCNSTVCLLDGTQRCGGYWIDVRLARRFLRSLRGESSWPILSVSAGSPHALAS